MIVEWTLSAAEDAAERTEEEAAQSDAQPVPEPAFDRHNVDLLLAEARVLRVAGDNPVALRALERAGHAAGGDLHVAAELLATARTRLGADCNGERGAIAIVASGLTATDASTAITPSCIEQRLALRLVQALHARSAPSQRKLEVGPAGRWFSLERDQQVSLVRRPSVHRMFGFLLRLRGSARQHGGLRAAARRLCL